MPTSLVTNLLSTHCSQLSTPLHTPCSSSKSLPCTALAAFLSHARGSHALSNTRQLKPHQSVTEITLAFTLYSRILLAASNRVRKSLDSNKCMPPKPPFTFYLQPSSWLCQPMSVCKQISTPSGRDAVNSNLCEPPKLSHVSSVAPPITISSLAALLHRVQPFPIHFQPLKPMFAFDTIIESNAQSTSCLWWNYNINRFCGCGWAVMCNLKSVTTYLWPGLNR